MESKREPLKVEHTKQRLEVVDVDMSKSTFQDVNLSGGTFTDVNLAGASITDANLSGVRIREANLTGASIIDSKTDEMTIDGVSVKELFAAYRTSRKNI